MKAAKDYKLNDIVEVEWDDAATMQGWKNPDTLVHNGGVSPCSTVGYFFRLDSKSISLSQGLSLDGDKCRMDTQAIPLGMVKKMRRLKRAR